MAQHSAVYSGPTAEDLDRIPVALKALRQWILWRGADRIDKKTGAVVGLNKIPYDPQTERKADTTEPTTWGTFEECLAALPLNLEKWAQEDPQAFRGGGLGFVFTREDPYVGIDLDKCRDLESGEIAPWAESIIKTLASYTELTPSRRGFHVLAQGVLPPGGRKKGDIEMYEYGRFFTMTGWHLPGTPPTMEGRKDQITAVHWNYFPPPRSSQKKSPEKEEPQETQAHTLDDTALLDKARAAKNKAKFPRLWAGDTADYPSPSEADLALCSLLAFWTKDPTQIDRLFRQSGLMRDKWDEQHGEESYGDGTIQKALAGTTEHYTPRKDASHRRNDQAQDTQGASLFNFKTYGKDDKKERIQFNVVEALTKDPAWHGVFAYDEFAECLMLRARPPYIPVDHQWACRQATDADDRATTLWLQGRHDLFCSTTVVAEGMQTMGERSRYHPVRDYLESLTWDGTPRLDTWLTKYCGAKDTQYTKAVGPKTLIGAAARIFKPGAKVDTMLMLVGEQGELKSTVFRTLASDDWFSDSLADLHEKDAMQDLQGKWMIEMSDLATWRRSETETIKNFLSKTFDRYRPSYGRRSQDFSRQCVFVGTTNKDTFLKDETGNRRFWPVQVEGECNIAALARDRDQLWAEAVERYRRGEAWYLSREQEQLAKLEQETRMEVDDWEESVLEYLGTLTTSRVTTKVIMVEHFKWDNPALWTQANTKRIGAILRRHGWQSKPYRDDAGVLIKGYECVTGNSPPTGNSVSANKNNAVTGVTGVTGDSQISEQKRGENDENDKNTKKTDSINTLKENTGNTGNTGNTIDFPGVRMLPVFSPTGNNGHTGNTPPGNTASPPLELPPPCVLCGVTDRWQDGPVSRCRQCWPPPSI